MCVLQGSTQHVNTQKVYNKTINFQKVCMQLLCSNVVWNSVGSYKSLPKFSLVSMSSMSWILCLVGGLREATCEAANLHILCTIHVQGAKVQCIVVTPLLITCKGECTFRPFWFQAWMPFWKLKSSLVILISDLGVNVVLNVQTGQADMLVVQSPVNCETDLHYSESKQ